MTEHLLCCEICDLESRDHPIAAFDLKDITYPISGGMFLSPDPEHELPAPFHPSLGWQDMKCPYCGQVPFAMNFDTYEEATDPNFPKQLLTPVGYIVITASRLEVELEDSAEKPDSTPETPPEPEEEPALPDVHDELSSEEVESSVGGDETTKEATYNPSGGECPYCRRSISTKPGHLKRHMLYYCKVITGEDRKILKEMDKKPGGKK